MIIQQDNLLHKDVPKTYLQNTEVAGTTIFRLRNTTGFGSSWAVQIGETGEEQTEILIISGNPPAAGTLGTTTVSSTFEHPADTPVYAIRYNQIVWERSTTGTAGTATAMTDGTITYQPSNPLSQFDDTTGSVSYAYRTYFRNSVLSSNSVESDWIVITPPFYSMAVIRQRIKEKLWNADYLSDPVIDNWTNEWLFEMRNAAISVNEDYALGTVDVGFDGTDGYGTITTTDFKQPRRVWITYNGQDFFQSNKMNINDFLPDEQFSSVHPYHAWLGNTIFQIRPDESGGTARLTYYRIGTQMVNDTDELELYMRGYTKSFVDYGVAQAYYKDNKTVEGQTYLALANGAKEQFKQELAPRDKSGPTLIDIVEAVSGEEFRL